MDHSRIPVLGHADGICHCYVDEDADLEMTLRVVADAKTQYVAVCNALETLLVHERIAPALLPPLKQALEAKQVTLIGCPQTLQIIPAEPASEEDWRTEYLDYKLSIKIVGGLDEAIDHINRYGSGHTDSIITADRGRALHGLRLGQRLNFSPAQRRLPLGSAPRWASAPARSTPVDRWAWTGW